MKLLEFIFGTKNKEVVVQPENRILKEKALQLFGSLTNEQKITILRYKSIPYELSKFMQNPNDPLFVEVWKLLDKYYT